MPRLFTLTKLACIRALCLNFGHTQVHVDLSQGGGGGFGRGGIGGAAATVAAERAGIGGGDRRVFGGDNGVFAVGLVPEAATSTSSFFEHTGVFVGAAVLVCASKKGFPRILSSPSVEDSGVSVALFHHCCVSVEGGGRSVRVISSPCFSLCSFISFTSDS